MKSDLYENKHKIQANLYVVKTERDYKDEIIVTLGICLILDLFLVLLSHPILLSSFIITYSILIQDPNIIVADLVFFHRKQNHQISVMSGLTSLACVTKSKPMGR